MPQNFQETCKKLNENNSPNMPEGGGAILPPIENRVKKIFNLATQK